MPPIRGPQVSTFLGATEVRPFQVGFPAELTSGWSASTGYSWKQLLLSGVTVAAESIPLTGDTAVTPDNDTGLSPGTKGWLEPDPQAGGWYFFPVSGGVSSGSGGCGWLSGLTTADCLRVTVAAVAGDCSDVPTDQDIHLVWDAGDSRWESTTDFVHDGAGSPGAVNFAWTNPNPPTLTIDGVSGFYLGCSGGALLFSFGGATLCAGTPVECANYFVVRVECSCCPIDGYAGEGWYCFVAAGDDCEVDTTYCAELLNEDKCNPEIEICDGPFDDQAECEAACVGSVPTVVVDCCETPVAQTLYLHITGGVTADVELTWLGGSQWRALAVTIGSCEVAQIRLTCTGTDWVLDVNDPLFYSQATTAAVCDPFELTFPDGDEFDPCGTGAAVTITVDPNP